MYSFSFEYLFLLLFNLNYSILLFNIGSQLKSSFNKKCRICSNPRKKIFKFIFVKKSVDILFLKIKIIIYK